MDKPKPSCQELSGRFNPGMYCTADGGTCLRQADWDANPDPDITSKSAEVQRLQVEFDAIKITLEREEKELAELLNHQEFLRQQTSCKYKRLHSADNPARGLSEHFHEYELGRGTR